MPHSFPTRRSSDLDYFLLDSYDPNANVLYATEHGDTAEGECHVMRLGDPIENSHLKCIEIRDKALGERPDLFTLGYVNAWSVAALKPGATVDLKLRVAKQSSYASWTLYHNVRGVFLSKSDQPVKVHYETYNVPACENGKDFNADGSDLKCE
jgi:hypothetical protein